MELWGELSQSRRFLQILLARGAAKDLRDREGRDADHGLVAE